MEAKHTPGPWKLSEWVGESEGVHHIGVDTDYPPGLCNGSRSVATMTGHYLTRREGAEPERTETIITNRANAALIAAAPKLLAACIDAELYIARGQGAPKVVICTLLDAIASAQPQR